MKYYNLIYHQLDEFLTSSTANYQQDKNSLYPDRRSKSRFLDNQVETAVGHALESVLKNSSNCVSVDGELQSIDMIKTSGNIKYVCQVKASHNSENSSAARESSNRLKEFCRIKNLENDNFIYEARKIAVKSKNNLPKEGYSHGVLKLEAGALTKVFDDIVYDEFLDDARMAIDAIYTKYESSGF